MNIEQYKKLEKFETHFRTAVKADFYRGLVSRDVEELRLLGDEIGIRMSKGSCPKCTLNFLKKVGSEFFKFKNELEREQKTIEKEENHETAETENRGEETPNTRRNSKRNTTKKGIQQV